MSKLANQTETPQGRGPGLAVVPLGALATVAVTAPAIVSVLLIRIGISNHSGGLIATGLCVGAFWLMMLIQTASAVVRVHKESE